jgi:hypothetical protein
MHRQRHLGRTPVLAGTRTCSLSRPSTTFYRPAPCDNLRRARRSRVGQVLGGQALVTVPFELRRRLAYDGKVLSAVGRIFVDSVLGFYRRRMRAEGIPGGQSGAVTVVQRCNSDLKLNPHCTDYF